MGYSIENTEFEGILKKSVVCNKSSIEIREKYKVKWSS